VPDNANLNSQNTKKKNNEKLVHFSAKRRKKTIYLYNSTVIQFPKCCGNLDESSLGEIPLLGGLGHAKHLAGTILLICL